MSQKIKTSVEIDGSLTANSIVKSGGTASQILAADGSVVTAGSGVTISGGTISASGSAGVLSFNTRTGAVTLTSGDVTTALGYTPYNASNPAGYISSYTEIDTLQSVTNRGQTTTNSIYAPNYYDNNNTAYYGDFAGISRMNIIEADNIGIGQAINTSYRLITNGSIYLNSLGSGFAEGSWKQRRGGGTFYDVIDTDSVSSYAVPPSRTITINGVTQDLSANRSFTVSGTVTSGVSITSAGSASNTPSTPSVNIGMYVDTYAFIDLATANTNGGWIDFSKADGGDYGGRIRYVNGSDYLSISAGTNEQVRIFSSNAEALGSFRAPLFYDSNDTSYYLNPAGASILNGLKLVSSGNQASGNDYTLWIQGTSDDWGIAVDKPSSDYSTKWNLAASHSYGLQGLKNSSEYFRVGTDLMYHDTQMRSPIYYDNNNTGYYVDPASTSNLALLSLYGHDNQLKINTYSGGAAGWFAQEAGVNKWETYHYQGRYRFYNYTTGQEEAFFDNANGFFEVRTSMRAPIFYDSNNTAYYGDFASSGTSLSINGGIVTTAPSGSILLKHEVSEANAWLFRENAPNWGLFWFNTGTQSGQVIGSYTTIGAELFGTNNAVGGFNPNSAWTGTNADTRMPWMLSNYTGYIWSNSTIYAAGDMRSPIYYDANDTSYYADFNSTSQSSVRQRGGTLHGPNTTWGAYLLVGGNGRTGYINDGLVASVVSTDGNLHLDAGSGKSTYLNWYDGSSLIFGNGSEAQIGTMNSSGDLTVNSSMRSPIFYDSSDTSYYWNPNTDASHRFQTPSGYIDIGPKNSGTCHIYTDRSSFYFNKDILVNGSTVLNTSNAPRAANSYVMFYEGFTLNADSMSTNSTGFTYSNGAPYTGPIARFSTGGGYDLWLNASYGGNGTSLAYRTRNGDTGTANSWHRIYSDAYRPYADDSGTTGQRSFNYLYASSYLESGGAVYGTIFYDNNNRGYYMDPDGTSQLSSIYTNNWVRVQGDSGVYSQDYGGHLRRPVNASHGTWEIFGYNKNGYAGMNVYDPQGYNNNYMHESGNGGLYQQNGNGWVFYHNRGNACLSVMTSTSSSSYKLYVGGSIYAEGDIVAYSDRRKKENIVTVDNALDTVNKLRGVYYNRIDDDSKKRQVGVIAQEIQEVLPEVVTYAKDLDEYGVSYGNITGLLIEAIKEQQTQIEELKELVNKLINK